MPAFLNSVCTLRFRNSSPLSVCCVVGAASTSSVLNAADLFFSGIHQATLHRGAGSAMVEPRGVTPMEGPNGRSVFFLSRVSVVRLATMPKDCFPSSLFIPFHCRLHHLSPLPLSLVLVLYFPSSSPNSLFTQSSFYPPLYAHPFSLSTVPLPFSRVSNPL